MTEDMNELVKSREEEYRESQTSQQFPGGYQEELSTHPTTSQKNKWECPVGCDKDFSDKPNPYNSMKAHFRGKKDGEHGLDKFYEFYGEEQTKDKKKPRIPRDSSAVKLEPVTATFDPAEEQEIAQLRKETAILRERLAQKGIVDKLGIPEEEQAQQQAFFEEEQRKEDVYGQMLRMQREEIKQLREDSKSSTNIQLKMMKANFDAQMNMSKSHNEMLLAVEKMKTESARQIAELSQNNRDYQQWAMRTGDKFLDYKFGQYREETSQSKQPQLNPADEDDIYKQLESISIDGDD